MKKVLLLMKEVFRQWFVMLNGEMSSSFTRMKFYLQMHDSLEIMSSVLRERFHTELYYTHMFWRYEKMKVIEINLMTSTKVNVTRKKVHAVCFSNPWQGLHESRKWLILKFLWWMKLELFQRHGAFLHVNVTMIQSSYNEDAIQLMLMMVRALRPPAHHPSLCFITS